MTYRKLIQFYIKKTKRRNVNADISRNFEILPSKLFFFNADMILTPMYLNENVHEVNQLLCHNYNINNEHRLTSSCLYATY
jgi:hypothetical protein